MIAEDLIFPAVHMLQATLAGKEGTMLKTIPLFNNTIKDNTDVD